MNAQTIVERILSDARDDAAAALRDAQTRGQAMEAESDERIEEDRVKILARATAEGEEERANMLRMAQLEERKLDLAMKRQVLDEAFDAVVNQLAQLPDDMARDYLETLLLEAADGECQIVTRPEDSRLYDEAFLNRVNGKLTHAHVTLSPHTRPLPGGFVLVRDGVEINCAYDAVVREMRSRLEAGAAAALFE